MCKSIKNTKSFMLALATLALAPVGAFADGPTAPLDLSATGTTLAGYVGTAAASGLGIAAAIWGLRVIIKAFKTVAK